MNLFAIIWLALMVLFLVVEGATVVMASLWFAFGALAAMVASILGAAVWLQIVVFFIVSAALLACLRPMVQKHFTPKLTATNVDAVIGKQGYVTADIDNVSATGSVKLGAMEWTARSATGEPIPVGTMVRVERIEGVKVFVSPAAVEAHIQ
jgi:membrane protein implicated in regulation of membrane protease activity